MTEPLNVTISTKIGASAPGFANFVIPGISLVLIVSYAPFTIAALLSDRFPDVPIGFFVSVSFLSMAIGTFLSASLTKTGLIVAPAVGVVSFLKQTSLTTISNAQFLLATLLAGSIAIWLSLPRRGGKPSRRQEFLDGIPIPVKVGVRGGVGVLLAGASVHGMNEVHERFPDSINGHYSTIYQISIIVFALSVGALLISEMQQQKLEKKLKSEQDRLLKGLVAIGLLILRSVYIIIPLIILTVFYRLGLFRMPKWEFAPQAPKNSPIFDMSFVTTGAIREVIIVLIFAVIILFVFVTDIPGSPYDVLKNPRHLNIDDSKRIDKSFLVTAIMSTVNPLVGLCTSVYYAENHIVIKDEASEKAIDNPKIGWFCGAIFLIPAALFAFLDFPVKDMEVWLLVAVAPSLFCLGVRLTAQAMERDITEEQKQVDERNKHGQMKLQVHTMASFYGPVSLTVLLTHFIGFELALPLGICYYYLSISGANVAVPDEPGAYGFLLPCTSILIALILGLLRLGFN